MPKFSYILPVLDHRSTEGPIKSPLLVSLSIGLGFLSGIAHYFFSDFLHGGRNVEYEKTDRALFSWKIHFCPNMGKKRPTMSPKIGFLGSLEKFY